MIETAEWIDQPETITCPTCHGDTCQTCECDKPECERCDNTGEIANPAHPMHQA